MTELRILTDHSAWRAAHRDRRRAAYLRAGLGEAAAEQLADRPGRVTTEPTVAEILADGTPVGTVAVALPPAAATTDADTGADTAGADRTATVVELHVDPAHTGAGHQEAALCWAEELAAEHGARSLAVQLIDPDPLFDHFPVRGQNRLKPVGTPAALPDGVTARPMAEQEYPAWLAREEEQYVFDIVRAGGMTPEQAKQKAQDDYATILPQGWHTPGHAFLVLEHAGVPLGTGWLHHGFLPGVTFGYSLFVEPALRGQGFGRAALALGEQATAAAGDSALMFNVFGGNEVAMGLYTSAGFRVLTEYRSRELG